MNSRAIAALAVALLAGCAPPASVSAPAPVSVPVTSDRGPSSPDARGYDLLYGFTGPPDGSWPDEGRMTFDKAGTLYGATYTGGTGNCRLRKMRVGCGTIFELSPRRHGGWSERILYSFKNLEDGASPFGTLTFDKSGNIYGVTLPAAIAAASSFSFMVAARCLSSRRTTVSGARACFTYLAAPTTAGVRWAAWFSTAERSMEPPNAVAAITRATARARGPESSSSCSARGHTGPKRFSRSSAGPPAAIPAAISP